MEFTICYILIDNGLPSM